MKRLAIICRSDYSGLAFQTRELVKLLDPAKILLIDSTPFNGREQHPEWYDEEITTVSKGFASNELLDEFLKDIDVLLTCEVPYNDNLYRMCRMRNIRTILQPNAELNPHILDRTLDLPDVFVLPSPWLEAETRDIGVETFIVKPPIIEPRDFNQHIPKEKGSLKVLHFGGRRAAHDRNGTEIVKALQKIDGIEIDIHDQSQNEVEDQRELYERGHHVVLIPRRYGGLCLPMLESLSYSLPVIMPNIEPNRQELPSDWLVNANYGKVIKTKHRIETYDAQPESIETVLKVFRDLDQRQYDSQRLVARSLYNKHQLQLDKWEELIYEN